LPTHRGASREAIFRESWDEFLVDNMAAVDIVVLKGFSTSHSVGPNLKRNGNPHAIRD